ncbi:hypothetical protein L1987_57254 [Smallanthus sonchifolius]|uniref:Uncharacterized protein n=1 Tax=Smallanthus sonchifolius TaxID=185202 RepID=A0ACB9DCI3_9ASTR|nr:hypothetical protein L1987_57254 [Smallanthus sonchifolius]
MDNISSCLTLARLVASGSAHPTTKRTTKMTTTLPLKLRGIFLPEDLPENQTNPVGDIFSKVISAISNFFQYLTGMFNQEFPPDTRDEQIHRWLDGATPYLIGAAVLITCLCCWSCILSCISCIFVGLFNAVHSFFRCLCCCGTRSARRMMKAPGRPSMRLPRDAFEGNPKGYFRSLRGKPNNFVY